MQEAEVITPPRKEVNGHRGLRAPGSRLPPRGTRVAPQIFTDAQVRDVSSGQRNVAWSPENILIDTVARLQQDLADIRAESRQLWTPGVPPVVPTPWQAAFMTTKVPRFGGTTSWEQYRQIFDAIVFSYGWDDATAANTAALPPGGRRVERGLVSADVPSNIENGSGGRVVGTLWVAGQIGGL